MKASNQKLKLMYLLKILMEQTDEDHTMTIYDMIEELKKYDIAAERKSIRDDLECLQLFGIDICSNKTKSRNYFIGTRDFELPELKLLVDSVQSAKFITKKKSCELIGKIEKLTSRENARRLQRQVFISNRVKTPNERIYYNIDKIHEAIAENKQITFKYFDLDLNKNKVYRKSGELYNESPIALTWDDEKYYMITYKSKYAKFVHYRVDKMEGVSLSGESREMPEKEFDLPMYAKKVFRMYGGDENTVSIMFENELVGVVYDRFGIDVPVFPVDSMHFVCRVRVAVSPHFLAWVMSFGKRAKIISPQCVADRLVELAKSVADNYDGA